MKRSKQLAFTGGTYSIVITVIVLALMILVNVFVSALPVSMTKFDISASKLYSVTSSTKVAVGALNDDVTIYWIVQAGKEDDVIQNLLAKYETLSEHIKVVKKNPDVYPAFASAYTDETVSNNSLVVECGEKFRYIPYSDIYVQDTDMYSYSYSTSFDGEGAITSAISNVTSDDLPILYCLEGHGESALPASFEKQVRRENIDIQSLSLLNIDAIPEDAACIMIHAPKSDISKEEKDMLTDYVAAGGRLLVLSGPSKEDELLNLNSILSSYGVTKSGGIVVEGDRNHYAFQSPYILLPDMADTDLTNSLISENYMPIMPVTEGLVIGESRAEVTALLTTSSDSFSKADGYNLQTYEKEDGDTDGPFAAAVSIETGTSGRIIWFSSDDFLQEMYNAYSSGANNNLCMNAVSVLVGEHESTAIRSKSLNYNYLTISASDSSLIKTLMIGLLPLLYLAVGITVVLHTRRKQNEQA